MKPVLMIAALCLLLAACDEINGEAMGKKWVQSICSGIRNCNQPCDYPASGREGHC